MQIPLRLYIPRLRRDPLQSLSTFYTVVKKLEHFEGRFFWPFRHANGTLGPIFGSKTAGTFCRGIQMQIPFTMGVLGLRRDPRKVWVPLNQRFKSFGDFWLKNWSGCALLRVKNGQNFCAQNALTLYHKWKVLKLYKGSRPNLEVTFVKGICIQ